MRSTSSLFSASAVWSPVTTQLWKYNGVQMTCRPGDGDGDGYAYLEISVIIVVEGVEIGGRSWDVGTSPPPLDMESTKTSGRGQRGCVVFNVPLTLHFNTSDGKEQEEHHRT